MGRGEGQARQSSNVHMQFTQLDGKLNCSVMTLTINLLHNGNRLPLYSSLFILHASHIDHYYLFFTACDHDHAVPFDHMQYMQLQPVVDYIMYKRINIQYIIRNTLEMYTYKG